MPQFPKLPAFLGFPIRIIGAVAILLACIGFWAKRLRPDGVMLYVVAAAAIVFAYPWFDTRLWLPFIPFLMGYVLLGIRSLTRFRAARSVAIAYCSVFSLLGILALAYTTRITFAGLRFPELYGDGNLRATYRLALRGEIPANSGDVQADALYLLNRYEPRAAGHPETH